MRYPDFLYLIYTFSATLPGLTQGSRENLAKNMENPPISLIPVVLCLGVALGAGAGFDSVLAEAAIARQQDTGCREVMLTMHPGIEDGSSNLIASKDAGVSGTSQSKDPQPDSQASPDKLAPITLVKKGWRAFLKEQDSGPMICTDRNSVTPHPNVVPLGYLQLESGITMDKFHRGGDFIAPETFARLGAWKAGELRFQVPNYVNSQAVQGTSDIQLSIKQEIEPSLLNRRGFDLGVIAGLSVPTGSRTLTTGTVDPFVQMIGFYKFHEKHTLGTSHSIFMPTQIADDPVFGPSRNRNVTYQPTVILFRHLGDFKSPERVDIWMEYAGQFYKNGPSSQIIDFGAVWRPYQRHQIDYRFGVGLSNQAPRAFLGMGYSILVGKVIPFYKKHPDHLYRP